MNRTIYNPPVVLYDPVEGFCYEEASQARWPTRSRLVPLFPKVERDAKPVWQDEDEVYVAFDFQTKKGEPCRVSFEERWDEDCYDSPRLCAPTYYGPNEPFD